MKSRLKAAIELGFQRLFDDIVEQDENGRWQVRPGYDGDVDDVTVQEAEELVEAMNIADEELGDAVPVGAREYGMCVLKGVLPFDALVSVDWGNVYIWIKQRSWEKLSRYLAKHAAKKGIKDLAKFTPGSLATAITIAAVGCLIWDD